MTSTVLNIFLHGMIALVHDRGGSGTMSAYLLKDVDHKAYLSFEMTGPSRCNPGKVYFGNTSCAESGSVCLCRIGDPVNMRFSPTASPATARIPRHGSVRPMRQSEASDFSWLVQMKDVDGNDGRAKSWDDARDFVLADLSFGWQRALTCELDQVLDDSKECTDAGTCEYKIYPNRFQSSLSGSSGHVQALAEGVVFESAFPNNQVTLLIKSRESGYEIELYLGCTDGKCPDLEISNDPVLNHEYDMFEDVGMHFMSYYKLAFGDNPKKKAPVRLREDAVPLSVGKSQLYTCPSNPRVTNHQKIIDGQGLLGDDAKAKELVKQYGDDFLKGIQTRIICPMALFEN
jgi:hypothetical protein